MNTYDDVTNLIQWLSFFILITDFNNTDLMKYLEHKDKLLDTIIQQQRIRLAFFCGRTPTVQSRRVVLV